MALISNNISGSISDNSRIGITGSVIFANVSPSLFPSLPADVTFYVSGSKGAATNQKSLFGGDLTVSGSLFAQGNSLEMTGSITATAGLSGSLTKLADGTSYLVAGSNITIASQSNGSVLISSTGGGGSSGVNLQFLAGTIASSAPSSSMESVGMDYIDTSSLPLPPTYIFSVVLAAMTGTVAYMDLYDYNGIFNGTPGPISGSVVTGSTQTYTYLSKDVSLSMGSPTGNGIVEARIWCDPTGSNLKAICKSAKLTIS